MTQSEALSQLTLMVLGGCRRVRLGGERAGKAFKTDPMSTDEAIYAIQTVYTIGGVVQSIYRLDD